MKFALSLCQCSGLTRDRVVLIIPARAHGEAPACPLTSQALPGSLSSSGRMIDKSEPRRFPPPWIAEETDACFIIRDHNGYALAYVYFEDEPDKMVACRW